MHCTICNVSTLTPSQYIRPGSRPKVMKILDNGLCEECNASAEPFDSIDFPCSGSLSEADSFVLYTDDEFHEQEVADNLDTTAYEE